LSALGRRIALPVLLTGSALVVSCNSSGGSDATPPPPTPSFTIGGSVSGLFGTNLVLENNGSDPLTINSNGSFTFAKSVDVGAAYSVTVRTQPSGTPAQTCTVSMGIGSVAIGAVTNVAVSCRARTGRYLYIPVKNPNAIAAFTIEVSTGELTPMAGSPFAFTATTVPPRTVVADPAARAVYVVSDHETAGSGASGVTSFVVDGVTGALTQSGPPATYSGEAKLPALHPSGGFLFVSVGPSNRILQSFQINATTGVLGTPSSTATPSNETPGAPVVRPNGAFLYLPSATTSTPMNGRITTYSINQTTGALTSQGGSTQIAGNVFNELAMHPAGTHLYTRNANGPAFTQRYTIASNNNLMSNPLTLPTIFGSGVVIAPGSGVYFSQQGGTVSVPGPGSIAGFVDVPSGAAATLQGSPYLTGGNNAGPPTLDPTGRFIAVTNMASGTVAVLRIDAATGALAHVPGSPVLPAVGTQPGTVTFDPSARFLYLTDAAQKSVSSYAVDATTGSLTFIDSEVLTATPERGTVFGLQ
jgi:6-phosphogluconolactonase (cycloisomerase 2 family)